MYFASRVQAGRMLAKQLENKYAGGKNIVLALGDGGVIVGAEIANRLGCGITLMISAEIRLPREPEAVAGITAGGTMAFNHMYSDGEIDELTGEYYGLIESEKLTQLHNMNHLLVANGTISRKFLKGHDTIIVSDGLKTGFEIDLAKQFLKPVETGKLVVATPFASVQAVDRMHVLADDLYCLSVIHDYIDTDHYYDDNKMPEHDEVVESLIKLDVS
jgi:predicted phosphoribosyltransferase